MSTLLCFLWHTWVDTIALLKCFKHCSRIERKCERCGRREIQLAQFNGRVQRTIKRHFEETRKYYSYKKGDWLDVYTKAALVSGLDAD